MALKSWLFRLGHPDGRASQGWTRSDSVVLAARPSDWAYSNYLEWTGERAGALVDREFMAHQFPDADEYRTFVSSYLQTRILPDDVQWYLDSVEDM